MTVEENVEYSGFGSKLLTILSQNTSMLNMEYKILSLKNSYIEHGSRKELLANAGFSYEGLSNSINLFFNITNEKIKIRHSYF